ncbi:MAG: FtsW/RodA/SpoVE family cell cycle protein, partial [Vicinamibacteria bacterium]
AARLQVDETTVSRRISRLEQELGVRMFDRTPQGWRITEPARLVLPHAEAVESSMARALEAVVSRAGDLSGTARLRAPDGFGAFLALGLTTMIAVQAFVNMSVVLGLLPTKGITLPLVSAGGSSLLINLLGIGVLLNISQHATTTETGAA